MPAVGLAPDSRHENDFTPLSPLSLGSLLSILTGGLCTQHAAQLNIGGETSAARALWGADKRRFPRSADMFSVDRAATRMRPKRRSIGAEAAETLRLKRHVLFYLHARGEESASEGRK